MISLVYPPYQDELLYSFTTRHYKYSPFKYKDFLDELLSKRNSISIHYFQYIKLLSKNLPNAKYFSEEELIQNNTYLPLIKPFFSDEKYESAKEATLLGSYGIQKKLSLSAEDILLNDKLKIKICPICYNEDIDKHTEAYLHRMHNYLGARTCHIHGCFLDSIDLTDSGVIDINDVNYYQPSVPTYPDDSIKKHYDDLNEDVFAVLSGVLNDFNVEKIQHKFREKARILGNVTIRTTENNPIIIGFKQAFEQEFLHDMESDFDLTDSTLWVRKHLYQDDFLLNPIRAILIIRYLFGSVEVFAHDTEEFKPFGYPPFPCLNSVCEHYHMDVIEYNEEALSNNKKGITGTFVCPVCGFTYTRNTIYDYSDDRLKYSYLKDRGHLWKQKLSELIEEEDLSLSALGRILNADKKEIKRHAISLGHEDWLKTKTDTIEVSKYTGRKLKEVDISVYKEEVLEYMKNNPTHSSTQIRNALGKAMYNLRKYDNNWLMDNFPRRVKIKKWDNEEYKIGFWKEKEAILLPLFESAIEEILSNNLDIRITWSELESRTNTFKSQPSKHIDKMPKLKNLVEKSLETVEQFKNRLSQDPYKEV